MYKIIPVLLFMGFGFAFGQYDTIQYLPPMFVSDAIKTTSHSCRDHYLILSTLESSTFQVTITRGDGSLLSGYAIQSGSQVSTGVFNLSRSTPLKIKFNGTGYNVENIISVGSLNTPINNAGYTMTADYPFFANIRHIASSQGGSLTCKGGTALGTNFFAGFPAMGSGSSSADNQMCHFISIMATLNNTNVTIDGFNSGVTFIGQPSSGSPPTAQPISITLNAGEAYVIAQTRDVATVNMDEYNGIHITSDKEIAINTGSWTGSGNGGSGRDIGIDQLVPVSYAGEKYAIVKGNNSTSSNTYERIVAVSTQTGTTNLTFGAGGAVTLTGQGDYAVISGNTHWVNASSTATGTIAHRNMAITSDQPILIFQTLFGSSGTNTNSMNVIPPLADCIGSDSIYIHDVEQFGSNTTVTITSPVSSTIKIEDESGTTLLTIAPATENLPGTIITDYRTSVYSVPNSVNDVLITGDEKFTLGFLGANSNMGGAGYMSAFSSRSVEYTESDPLFIGNGRVRLDLCEENPSYISIAESSEYDTFEWYRDNMILPGETNDSLAVSLSGDYRAIATYCSLPLESTLISVDEFGSPGEQGFSKIAAIYESETFDGFSEGNQVVDWDEQSKNFNTASLSTNGPKIRTADTLIAGFHPVPKFTASNSEYLKSINPLNDVNGSNHFSFFIVLKDSNTQVGDPIFSFENSSTGAKIIKTATGYSFSQPPTSSGGFISANVDVDQSEFVILSGVHTGSVLQLFANGKAGPVNFGNTTSNTIDIGSSLIIGGGEEGSNDFFDGYIAEFVVFDTTILPSERQILETYYAVKYGITLDVTNDETGVNDGDYVSNNGTVVWDYSANTAYHNRIAAIGLDICGRLRQWQNKSAMNDDYVSIGIGTIAATVGTNPNSFSIDNTYFVWGHDNGAFGSQWVTDYGATVNSEVIETRVARVWKTQETGTVGSLRVQFNLGSGVSGLDLSDTRLLVDADGVFATGATSIAPTSFNAATGIVAFDHDFTSGTGFFFSLGTVDATTMPLPVDLIEYTVEPFQNDNVKCNWLSAVEINNDYYTLERSIDGVNWMYLTTVKGVKNSVVAQGYEYIDKEPYTGVSYYRLSQTDLNGMVQYLGVESVSIQQQNNVLINVYPNPAQNNLFITANESAIQSVRLVNGLGQVMQTAQGKNAAKLIIDISDLPRGIYFVEVKYDHMIVNKKVILN